MRIAFFVNDIEREFAGYTTTVLAHQAALSGHDVCYVTPSDFVLTPDDRLHVHGRFLPKTKWKDRDEMFAALQKVGTKTRSALGRWQKQLAPERQTAPGLFQAGQAMSLARWRS